MLQEVLSFLTYPCPVSQCPSLVLGVLMEMLLTRGPDQQCFTAAKASVTSTRVLTSVSWVNQPALHNSPSNFSWLQHSLPVLNYTLALVHICPAHQRWLNCSRHTVCISCS